MTMVKRLHLISKLQRTGIGLDPHPEAFLAGVEGGWRLMVNVYQGQSVKENSLKREKFFSFLASAQEVSFRPSTSPTPCDNRGNSGNLLQHPDSLLCDSRCLRCCSHIICDQGFHHSVPFGGDC